MVRVSKLIPLTQISTSGHLCTRPPFSLSAADKVALEISRIAARGFAAEGSPSGPPAAFPALQNQVSRSPQRRSDITTAVRSAVNSEWSEVVIKETGETYYWNERTGQTTAVGEPRPEHSVVKQQKLQQSPALGFPAAGGTQTMGRTLIGLVGMGAGVGLVFGIIGRLF